ncbi:MAG: MopE-related protein [Sandaracinaceae bacterium]
MARSSLRIALLAPVVSGLVGCSVLVGSDVPETRRCQVVDGIDPCAELGAADGTEWRCRLPTEGTIGECIEVMPNCQREVCGNGMDDDCDEMIDELDDTVHEDCDGLDEDCDGVVDEGLDEDGDTFTGCRTGPTEFDCDDRSANVHPSTDASTEVCDGLDNDCNPMTVDGSGQCDADTQVCNGITGVCEQVDCTSRPALCSAIQTCDATATPPVCVSIDMTCLNPDRACTGGMVCNVMNGACTTPQPLGSPCAFDAECVSGLCAPLGAGRITSAHVGGATGICSTACCSNSACGNDTTCWASGSGARLCIPNPVLAMGAHGVPTPSICHVATQCSGQECVLTQDDAYEEADRLSLSCGAPLAPRDTGSCSLFRVGGTWVDSCDDFFAGVRGNCMGNRCYRHNCSSNGECPTGLCVGGRCSEPCGTASDCPTNQALPPPSCDYASVPSAGRSDYVPICVWSGTGGEGGATCASDNDCRDYTCVGPRGEGPGVDPSRARCRAACCDDSHCAGTEQCRPVFVHGHYQMHCMPREIFGPVGMPP